MKTVKGMSRQDYDRARSRSGLREFFRAPETEPAVQRAADRFADRSDARRRGYDQCMDLASSIAAKGGVRSGAYDDPRSYERLKRSALSSLRISNGYRAPQPATAPAGNDDTPNDPPEAA
jgi:hypothetical protein